MASQETELDVQRERPLPVWLLVFALMLPTAITWIYFVLLANDLAYVQRGACLLGKSLQLALPVACWGLWRGGVSLRRPQRSDLIAGSVSGLIIAAAAWVGYRYVLLPAGGLDGTIEPLQEKLAGMQLTGPAAFIALGCFYVLIHSLFEEYYWRWFVFGALRRRMRWETAAAVSSFGFASHHVLVLAAYFGGLSGMTLFLSLAVAVGGLLWAWLYQRSGVLYGVWLSHLLVDAALFAIGYDLLRRSLGW